MLAVADNFHAVCDEAFDDFDLDCPDIEDVTVKRLTEQDALLVSWPNGKALVPKTSEGSHPSEFDSQAHRE